MCDHPEVAIISDIYVVNGGKTVIFKAKCFEIYKYISLYRAYAIRPLHKDSFFAYDQLPVHLPLHPRICRALPDCTVIIMPFCVAFDC